MANKETALDTLVREELGIDPEELGGSAWTAAASSFLLFAVGAIFPVAPFFWLSGMPALVASLAAGGVALILIGAGTSLFTGRGPALLGAAPAPDRPRRRRRHLWHRPSRRGVDRRLRNCSLLARRYSVCERRKSPRRRLRCRAHQLLQPRRQAMDRRPVTGVARRFESGAERRELMGADEARRSLELRQASTTCPAAAPSMAAWTSAMPDCVGGTKSWTTSQAIRGRLPTTRSRNLRIYPGFHAADVGKAKPVCHRRARSCEACMAGPAPAGNRISRSSRLR